MLLPDTALARRIESAECRLSLAVVDAIVSRGGDAGSMPVDGGAAVYSGTGSPINKVIGIGFETGMGEAPWDTVERFFAARHCPVRVEISILADSSIPAALTRRGYVLQAFEHVLGFDLSRGERARLEPSRELTIGRDQSDPATWIHAVVEGFSHTDGSPQSDESFTDEALRRVMRDLALSAAFTRYIARVHGTIAGGAGLRVADGIAQFCGASTLPAFRRRGVQRALLRGRLADAREAGCDVAVITTAPGSKSNHNALREGFEQLYSRAVLVKDPA